MKITIKGVTTDNRNETVDLTIEYNGGNQWVLNAGKKDFLVDELEKSMQFLKDNFTNKPGNSEEN